jgi:hypothetical protein
MSRFKWDPFGRDKFYLLRAQAPWGSFLRNASNIKYFFSLGTISTYSPQTKVFYIFYRTTDRESDKDDGDATTPENLTGARYWGTLGSPTGLQKRTAFSGKSCIESQQLRSGDFRSFHALIEPLTAPDVIEVTKRTLYTAFGTAHSLLLFGTGYVGY